MVPERGGFGGIVCVCVCILVWFCNSTMSKLFIFVVCSLAVCIIAGATDSLIDLKNDLQYTTELERKVNHTIEQLDGK